MSAPSRIQPYEVEVVYCEDVTGRTDIFCRCCGHVLHPDEDAAGVHGLRGDCQHATCRDHNACDDLRCACPCHHESEVRP